MVHPRTTTSDENSSNTIVDSHLNRCIGTVDEDRSHGRLSRESESDQTSSRHKFVTNPRKNIDTNGEDSIINYTKTRTTSGFVHKIIHRGASVLSTILVIVMML
jgi:hypothetical protein